MPTATIIISCLALALSAFTFYWTTLRNKRAFFLIRIANPHSAELWQFALANGGKNDLLITSINCLFETKDKSREFYPKQHIHFQENDGMLLQSGKAFHCRVEFIAPFTSNFALAGEQDAEYSDFYFLPMYVEIEWVEMDGTLHKKKVPHTRFGFDASGQFVMGMPLGNKHDLYAAYPTTEEMLRLAAERSSTPR